MIKRFLSVAFVGLLLVACKENNAEPAQTETAAPVTEAVQTETPAAETVQQQTENTEAVQVQPAQPAAQPAQPTNAGPFIQQQPQQVQQTQNIGQTAPGWSGKPNPPHGQEGHRCDIQVGAILP